LKNLGDVSIEKGNVGSGFELLVMLSTHAGGGIVFWPHFVFTAGIALTHRFYAPMA